MFFSGEYEATLDAKGRLVLPTKLKAALPPETGDNIVLMRGFEPCLVLYPHSEWKKVFDKVAGLNEFNEEYRNFQRNFLRGNTELELDGNGRFIVPKSMMKFASIEKDVILVGIGNRIEIWNPESYENFLIKDQQKFSQMAQKVLGSESGMKN
jgi:MraZ protein